MSKIIAITGGIGSGKSIIAKILLSLGYRVYDCDMRARRIMDESSQIHEDLITEFGDDIIRENKIDRETLARVVFNNTHALSRLNSIVHPKVREDLIRWINNHCIERTLFIETAILEQSNLINLIDEIWIVEAPIELRINRVINRNKTTREEVERRIVSQKSCNRNNCKIILNDGKSALLPQLWALLS